MTDTIFSQQGDTLDALIWRERGLGSDDLATVLRANTGIAGHGAILPTGTPVAIPAITAPALPMRDIVQLWD